MTVRPLAIATLVLVCTCLPGKARAATPVQNVAAATGAGLVEVRLTDGSVLYGTVQSETPAQVVVRTIAGLVVTVERGQIVSMNPARGRVVDGEFQRADSNATRLLFGPTGRTLAKGEGYVGLFELVLPFVQYGVTDRLSVGAGTPFIFFDDESSRPVWLTPKFQVFRSDRTTASIGVMHFVVFGEDTKAGLAYGVVTRGHADNAFTVGAGWAYARYSDTEYRGDCSRPPSQAVMPCVPEDVTKTPGSPVFMIGGERRLSRRIKLVTENYGFEGGAVASAGVRFLGDHLSADLGLFAPISSEDFLVLLPIVNFVWTFGR